MKDNKNNIQFFTALLSVMAAAFGVQKRKNMQRDLQAPNPVVYVVAALVFVLLFIGAITAVVIMVVPEHLT
ncbi:MAG: hypothetical protein CL679_06040 [Bermanella sp.]|nr:hypothetical protein [Bermanella sp.]|tara:strand:+ start:323 stop:535 length:213 start_codon:yes stop_codon:yes gene_type:complete